MKLIVCLLSAKILVYFVFGFWFFPFFFFFDRKNREKERDHIHTGCSAWIESLIPQRL